MRGRGRESSLVTRFRARLNWFFTRKKYFFIDVWIQFFKKVLQLKKVNLALF